MLGARCYNFIHYMSSIKFRDVNGSGRMRIILISNSISNKKFHLLLVSLSTRIFV